MSNGGSRHSASIFKADRRYRYLDTLITGFVVVLLISNVVGCGEFANSYTMAKMKLLTNGRHLWTRTIGSTVVGQGIDSVVVMSCLAVGRTGRA